MSSRATGKVVDETGGVAGLTVVAQDTSSVFSQDLAHGQTDGTGAFDLTYPDSHPDVVQEYGPRRIRFRVLDQVHRRLASKEVLDVAGVLAVETFTLGRRDHSGWLVTLGAGEPKPPVRDGNAVGVLVDNVVAWQRVAKVFREAEKSIEFMQLLFDIPPELHADTALEDPEMVLQFDDPPPTVAQPRGVRAQDARPERLLLDAVNAPRAVDVRLLLNRPQLDGHLVGASLVIPGLGLVIVLIGGLALALGKGTSLNEVRTYFDGTLLPKKKIEGATTSVFGPTHAKLAIVDGLKAVSIASPFDQGYYGDAEHAVDDPRRGNKDNVPIHDVSFAVNGPAVLDLHNTYRLHWNAVTDEADHLGEISPPPPQTDLDGLDAVASLQVVRTLGSGRFTDPADGEKGVLEAYLRAIANAQDYIYLENQYLTNDAIGNALLQALVDPARPKLNVILMINIDPDIPCYPRWQRKLVTRIRQGLIDAGQPEARRRRFGAFTRWTHEAATADHRARVVPNYLHSKVGIVDGKWATLGSANLDGASLDYFQFLHALHFGDVRNSEANFLILNGIEGAAATPVVDAMRRRLWAEHLGLETADGRPNPQDPLLDTPPDGGWVERWHTRAGEKLKALGEHPGTPVRIRVLPWPSADETLNSPREHLAELLGKTVFDDLGFDPISGTRRFSFKTGLFRDKAPEVDEVPEESGI
ncbi:phospholipase D-like domain-containing protein [Amycolatopsis vastitatis]|nr:phospholipase D-like domain-containing protein [Amycolatopsis vastitatis]